MDNGAAPPPTTVLDQRYADLAPQGTILFYDSGPGRIAVEIPVVNIGNAPLPLDAGEIRFNFLLYQGSVYPSALGPGQQGWFEFFIPTTLNTEAGTIPSIAQCEPNDVVIDHGHTMQLHSNPDDGSVYSNDHLFLQSQCLTWTKPITMDLRLRYGLPEGASLQDIVSSKVQGSSLGFCSHCHHSDRQDPANPHQPQQYFPLIHHDTDTYTVTSGATIGGRS